MKRIRTATLAVACSLSLSVAPAMADEGGLSFWLPDQFGSLTLADARLLESMRD